MEEFLNFIAEILEVPVEMISLEASQDTLEEWDSLMQLRLVSSMEEEYGVEIPIDEISKITKLADFYKYIAD